MSATPTVDASEGHIHGFGPPYRSYVLTALLIVYILNFVDRGRSRPSSPQ